MIIKKERANFRILIVDLVSNKSRSISLKSKKTLEELKEEIIKFFDNLK